MLESIIGKTRGIIFLGLVLTKNKQEYTMPHACARPLVSLWFGEIFELKHLDRIFPCYCTIIIVIINDQSDYSIIV